jgi:hypothetical protein
VILLDFLGFNKKIGDFFFEKALNLWPKSPIFLAKVKNFTQNKKRPDPGLK